MKKPEEILLDLNETEEARIQTAFKLENRFDKTVINAFKKAIKSEPSPIVRHEIALALGTLGKKEAVPYLEKLLKCGIPELEESTKIALERIKS
jgi:HEAT repeat protein